MAMISRRHLRTQTVQALGAAYALINAGVFLRATAMPDSEAKRPVSVADLGTVLQAPLDS
jgi:hypothetical protein